MFESLKFIDRILKNKYIGCLLSLAYKRCTHIKVLYKKHWSINKIKERDYYDNTRWSNHENEKKRELKLVSIALFEIEISY